MSEVFGLLFLCLVLFLGTFIFGYIPLYFTLPSSKLLYASTLGGGILVGTAFVVIIPEGIHMLYSSCSDSAGNYIGISIVSGFVFMLLMDRMAGWCTKNDYRVVSSEEDSKSAPEQEICGVGTTTIGLLIHNMVDGFALGCSALAGATSALELVVFVAILLHKVPAALAFSTILLQQGKSKSQVLKLLTLFCAMVPLSTLVTFTALSFLPVSEINVTPQNVSKNLHESYKGAQIIITTTSYTSDKSNNIAKMITASTKTAHDHSSHDSHDDHNEKDHVHSSGPVDSTSIGLCLLFSAGTFLYVSLVHILPEVTEAIGKNKVEIHDLEEPHGHNHSSMPMSHTLILCIGILLPLAMPGHNH